MNRKLRTFVNRTGRAKTSGFTLAEVLGVVFILGVFAAIAAPGFIGLINRQRVRTVQGGTYQALQTAKSKARTQKMSYCASFMMESGVPKVAIHPSDSPPSVWEPFNFEIESEQVELFTEDAESDRICFDFKGNTEQVGATVVMQIPEAEETRLCVGVASLVGVVTKGSGSACPGSLVSDAGNGGSAGGGSLGGNNPEEENPEEENPEEENLEDDTLEEPPFPPSRRPNIPPPRPNTPPPLPRVAPPPITLPEIPTPPPAGPLTPF